MEEEVKVEEEEERDRERRGMEKQDAALEVDGVSCYVLLSTLGRSPNTHRFSLFLSLSLLVPWREAGRGRRRKEYNIKSHPRPGRIIRGLRDGDCTVSTERLFSRPM